LPQVIQESGFRPAVRLLLFGAKKSSQKKTFKSVTGFRMLGSMLHAALVASLYRFLQSCHENNFTEGQTLLLGITLVFKNADF